MLDYYGLSESYPLCGNFPFMDVREGSMGKPMPGWDVQILDEDEARSGSGSGARSASGRASNPHYPLGYWRNEEAARVNSAGSGSTPRTRPSATRTATSGTPVAPTT